MKKFLSGIMATLMLLSTVCYGAQVFQGNITGNAATVTNGTFTTSLTNNTGAGTLTWPAAGATLTIPSGGGTLGTGAFASAYSLPTATSSVLGGVKPDGTSILNTAGAISATAASVGAAAVGATYYLGTTSTTLNRASGAIALTGITSIDGSAATATKATNIAGGAGGSIHYQSAADTTAMLANGSAGQLLRSAGTTAAPVWSTPTYPNTATSGKILVGDGTNVVLSTPTFPNASATSGKIIKSDGTNWLASTETYAAPGTSGNVLTSDGTNWTSASPFTTGGGLTCTARGGVNDCTYAGSVANNGTLTLPTVTTGWSGQGEITIGTDNDHAAFTTDAAGNVNLIWTSAGIVANAATSSKTQIGAATPANPVVITNASGGALNYVVTFKTH